MTMKNSFLVVHDYGMGGVWSIISARSKDEILQKYPMLSVCEARPNWMTDEHYRNIAATRTIDIDEEPSGWLLSVSKKK
jgi:hypothetical protein